MPPPRGLAAALPDSLSDPSNRRQGTAEGDLDPFSKVASTPAIVTSNVLNEGGRPDASIGVILSGSASAQEFVQQLGRILRRGDGKRAVLARSHRPRNP